MSKPTNRLGRGLSALLPSKSDRVTIATASAAPTSAALPAPAMTTSHALANPPAPSPQPQDPTPGPRIKMIPIDSIRPNPHQPRTVFDDQQLQELATSIKAQGILQPILVRPVSPKTVERASLPVRDSSIPASIPDPSVASSLRRSVASSYELVAGERRWRAAQLAGLTEIPAIIRELSDRDSMELALIENLQREDLRPLERAHAYKSYLETFNVGVDVLSDRLGESRANVSNYLRILKLRKEVLLMVESGELGMGQARAIAGIPEPDAQLITAILAKKRNLSVRQVEALIANGQTGPEFASVSKPENVAAARHLLDVERELTSASGLQVRLQAGKRKNAGRVIISYNSLDEFDIIAQKLGASRALD